MCKIHTTLYFMGLINAPKNSLRTTRGKLCKVIFLSAAIIFATFLKRSLICVVKVRRLSNVTPSSFCEVTCSISLPLHAILRALFEVFLFSKRLPIKFHKHATVAEALLPRGFSRSFCWVCPAGTLGRLSLI